MTNIPRWTLSELETRYSLEPSLQDVFVEGDFDRDVLSKCFSASKATSKIAYDIDAVDIPYALLATHGLTEGKKQRVIVLARELSGLPTTCGFRCLVDRDLDHWFGSLEEVPRLIWTEHTSIELYFFSEEFLRELLLTVSKARIEQWETFVDSFVQTLVQLYALRLSDRELGWHLKWLPLDRRCLSVQNEQIKFDLPDYVSRLLLKNSKSGETAAFMQIASIWKTRLTGDCRSHMRGHDFLDLLAWVVGKFGGLKEFASVVPIQRVMLVFTDRIPELLTLV